MSEEKETKHKHNWIVDIVYAYENKIRLVCDICSKIKYIKGYQI